MIIKGVSIFTHFSMNQPCIYNSVHRHLRFIVFTTRNDPRLDSGGQVNLVNKHTGMVKRVHRIKVRPPLFYAIIKE